MIERQMRSPMVMKTVEGTNENRIDKNNVAAKQHVDIHHTGCIKKKTVIIIFLLLVIICVGLCIYRLFSLY